MNALSLTQARLDRAQTPVDMLEALYAADLIESWTMGREDGYTVEVTYRDEDGARCTPQGLGQSLETAVERVILNCSLAIKLKCSIMLNQEIERRKGVA